MNLKIALLVVTVMATGVAGCAHDGYGHRHGGFGHDHDGRGHHDRNGPGDHHDDHDGRR